MQQLSANISLRGEFPVCLDIFQMYIVGFGLETTLGSNHPLDVLYKRILDDAYASGSKGEGSDISRVLTVVVYAYNPLVPISTFHASFSDFLSNQSSSSKHYLDPCASHKYLALQCLSLIDAEWANKTSVTYLAERRHEEISESLAYACCSWAFHLTDADHNNYCDTLKNFFGNDLLRWMDCLSILGKLEIAGDSLLKLKSWVR